MASLRRTAAAEFTIEDAHTVDQVADAVRQDLLDGLLVHPRRVLPGIPCVTADEDTVGRIRHGRSINLAEFSKSKWVKVFAGQTELICLASRVAGSLFHPKVVLI